ncbi:conserved hypothetical protein (DUF1801) [Alteracholeplasma palmae J233]|uniref:YdhG-like domain-containing protein n=1 Tax=Alteracholeplasma palmae (strain ATCC 49389 / J233) TaxID=1318466 RepID=U4KPJ9_ALTPJ|nr:DUF1801 domain-containing protein [Alteracholeplasma palmae]CCV64180.1 conserved hypothetical protein (DUF1801) [Alteracholeplasma palmae J233]
MKLNSVLEYLETLDSKTKNKIITLRNTILNFDSRITETISYNMPAYKINKAILYYFVYKNHIGIYPHGEAINYFKEELKNYKCSKGAIQIPIDDEIPLELIVKILDFNIKTLENKEL